MSRTTPLSFVRLRLWQANCETRASIVRILSQECSAVRLDDAAGNGQSHSGPVGFCRKEWLEKLLDNSPGETGTRIAHADKNLSVSVPARADKKASRIGANSRHGFKGVHHEIEKHLQQLHGICHYAADGRIDLRRYGHLSFYGVRPYDSEEISDNLSNWNERAATFGLTHHVADTLDDLACAVPIGHNVSQ